MSVDSVNNARGFSHLVQEEEIKDEHVLTKPKYVRGPAIDKKSFIRIYYVSALRVPAAECWDLVFQLREHLLNWPRVHNIGRVSGDDVDDDLATAFVETAERKQKVTRDEIRAAVYVDSEKDLSTNKLAVEPNSKGSGRRDNGSIRDPATLLELVQTEDKNEQKDNTSTRGVPYFNVSKKWAGPTRLLLLDEKYYVGTKISELPPALQCRLCTPDSNTSIQRQGW